MPNKIVKYFILLIFLLPSYLLIGQARDIQVGSSNMNQRYNGGYFDYSKPNSFNMEVSIWGFVKYPGKYLIPEESTVMDLISYAGGPTENANMDDMRIYRETKYDENGTIEKEQKFITFSYYDLLWSDDPGHSKIEVPTLKAGDNISVPGEPKIWDKDWINIILSITSILISLTTLIITIGK